MNLRDRLSLKEKRNIVMIISVHNCLKTDFSDKKTLIDVINEDFINSDFPGVNDVRTIDRVINTIENLLKIQIERKNISSKNKRGNISTKINFKYVNPNQQIAKLLLEESGNSEMVLLYDVLLSLKGLAFNYFTEKIFDVLVDKGFGKLAEIKYFEKDGESKYDDIKNSDYTSVIEFDSHSKFEIEQSKTFYDLFDNINRKQAININYSINFKYNKELVISPFLIKQYNKRWFLFGYNHEEERVSNFGLDRIKSISISQQPFNLDNYISFFDENYFEDIVGVSKNIKNTIHKVKIRIDNKQYQYINTKPIHDSQKRISEECTDEYQTIIIEVIINFELIALLLSFGSNIKIIEPKNLQATLIEIYKKAIENYE